MAVAAGWISGRWIFSNHAAQNGKYWIDRNWIWGPTGSSDVNTKFWIDDGWIWGPAGRSNCFTGFFIVDEWIYGPSPKLPFAG
jgi:hypothetical protein